MAGFASQQVNAVVGIEDIHVVDLLSGKELSWSAIDLRDFQSPDRAEDSRAHRPRP